MRKNSPAAHRHLPLATSDLQGSVWKIRGENLCLCLKHPDHEQADEAGRGGQRARGRRGVWGAAASLDHLKVVQNGHDVLRHEDVASVNGHASDRDQQGV